jgi:hypothetical protein
MSKTKRVLYWTSTLWLSLGMLSTGIVQIVGVKKEVDMITHLGYPAYFITLLGVWKIAGVVAVLLPKFVIAKEWAYAGFFFTMTGALISHVVMKDPASELFPSLLLLTLTIVSWSFRPESRKVVAKN